jgi:RNA polymerase sigma-70 factor (ECF subfamily)
MDAEKRFRALFETAYPAVRRYAHHRGLADADAEDLAADVFAVAWRRLHKVPADDPIPWLLGVARNHWRNHLRKIQRSRSLTERLQGEANPITADPALAAAGRLGKALLHLSANDREILLLIAWDELTPQQAARVLGCSAATARVRLHRARKRFAHLLELDETNASSRTVMGVESE